MDKYSTALTLSVPNFRLYLSSALFFFCFKQTIDWKEVYKVERLHVKQRRS